jgi:hypothetical protein
VSIPTFVAMVSTAVELRLALLLVRVHVAAALVLSNKAREGSPLDGPVRLALVWVE